MCGHGIIALVHAGIEQELFPIAGRHHRNQWARGVYG
jgi:hypothetical protein